MITMIRCAGETGAATPASGRVHRVGSPAHRHARQREERAGKIRKKAGQHLREQGDHNTDDYE